MARIKVPVCLHASRCPYCLAVNDHLTGRCCAHCIKVQAGGVAVYHNPKPDRPEAMDAKHTLGPERVKAAHPKQACCLCQQPVGTHYYRIPVPPGDYRKGWATNLCVCRACARAALARAEKGE